MPALAQRIISTEEDYFIRKAEEARQHRKEGKAARIARINADVRAVDIVKKMNTSRARLYRFEAGRNILDRDVFKSAFYMAIREIQRERTEE